MKYEITDKTIIYDGITLYQIKALRNIPMRSVLVGSLGGYIEKESNLSQDGESWVYPDAKVLDDAQVLDDASVRNTSILRGDAIISDTSTLRGDCLMTTDTLEGVKTVVHETITMKIERASFGTVHWSVWVTDEMLHCDCISHPFEWWNTADDDAIIEMNVDALEWWNTNKETIMDIITTNREYTMETT